MADDDIEIVEEVTGEVEKNSVLETEDVLLARLYDTCLALGKRVQINTVQTEDKKELIIIVLKDVKYDEENGFEKTT